MKNTLLNLTGAVKSDELYVCTGGTFHPSEHLPQSNIPSIELTLTKELKAILKTLIKCSANTDIRYYLNGLYFDTTCIVATDGHRLMKTTPGLVDTIEGYDFEKGVIMPIEFIRQLFRFDVWNNGTLEISARFLTVELHDGRFEGRPIDGKFPDYERMLTTLGGEPDTHLELTKELSKSIKQTAKVEAINSDSFKKYGGIKLTNDSIKFPNETLTSDVKIKTTVKELEIGFNYRYLLDFPLGNFSARAGKQPSQLIKFESNDGNYAGAMMQMRL